MHHPLSLKTTLKRQSRNNIVFHRKLILTSVKIHIHTKNVFLLIEWITILKNVIALTWILSKDSRIFEIDFYYMGKRRYVHFHMILLLRKITNFWLIRFLKFSWGFFLKKLDISNDCELYRTYYESFQRINVKIPQHFCWSILWLPQMCEKSITNCYYSLLFLNNY